MRLFVPLTRDEFDRLSALAQAERRRPQDQAAVLLAQSLTAHPLDPSGSKAKADALRPADGRRECTPAEAR